MNILGVDTTRKGAYIFALLGSKRILDALNEEEKQSENLMTHIDNLLQKNNLQLSQFDAFAVITGPGSFTGIRVGLATIKAFAYALRKPIIAVNFFEVLGDFVESGVIISECTANSVYYCDVENHKLKAMGVEQLENIEKFSNKIVIKEEHLSGNSAYNFNVLYNYPDLVFDKFSAMAKNKQFTVSPQPLYVQLSQAERNLESKND